MQSQRSAVFITEPVLVGLLALHQYRLLSVEQFARATSLSVAHVRDVLRRLERQSVLGSIGNVGLRGGSKAPKLYYLTRSGFDAMLDAGGFMAEQFKPFKRAHTGTRWSPIMAHRMATIDLLLAIEIGVSSLPDYELIVLRHEYRRKQIGKVAQPETSDFVAEPFDASNRIVPDAAFVLGNRATGARGLYFIETDQGTERLARGTPDGYSIVDKFALYERYLRGGRFADTYRAFGDFRFFTLLFVTTTPIRIEHTRTKAGSLSKELHPYFKLASFADAKADPFAPIWQSRDPDDPNQTSIIKRGR